MRYLFFKTAFPHFLKQHLTNRFVLVFLVVSIATACHRFMEPFTAQSSLAVLQDTSLLPRNINVMAFDPHRANFTCTHEATRVPPIKPEADALYWKAMVLTGQPQWPNMDYRTALKLWQQAADMGHWKAMMMVADTVAKGAGSSSDNQQYTVSPDPERAVRIVEQAMRLGIPAAFGRMGNYYASGIGVSGDTTRAYAFWQLAADMGSPDAQTYIGTQLDAAGDNAETGMWGNQKVAYQMLECAYAQGYGKAAFELGSSLNVKAQDDASLFPRALQILHDGVKFGSQEAADYLGSSFRLGDPLVKNRVDRTRSKRYDVLGDALYHDPDLRFPNLDKVLPLPPAKLPQWDGNPDSLINAAKAVVPIPPQPVSQESQRKGRYHLPPQYRFAGGEQHYQWKEPQHSPYSHSARVAPYEGYWLPNIPTSHHEHVIQSLLAVQPGLYKAGEAFDPVPNLYFPQYGCPGTTWRCVVVERVPDKRNPRVKAGLAREVVVPKPTITARIGAAAPQSGYWLATLPKDHPHATIYTQHYPHQGYFAQGEQLPAPHDVQLLGINPRDVTWQLTEQSEPERLFGIG